MSVRTDIDDPLKMAESAITEYGRIIGLAFEDAAPLLYRALSHTYDAILILQDDPDQLSEYLDGKVLGPKSSNSLQPIVRKLWRGVPTRDALHRYASCLAQAQRLNVVRGGFAEWLRTYKGGIRAAARDWSRRSNAIDAKHKARTVAAKTRAERLKHCKPVELPSTVGERQDGLYLAVIRVNDGSASLLQVLDTMSPAKVDQIVIGAMQ